MIAARAAALLSLAAAFDLLRRRATTPTAADLDRLATQARRIALRMSR